MILQVSVRRSSLHDSRLPSARRRCSPCLFNRVQRIVFTARAQVDQTPHNPGEAWDAAIGLRAVPSGLPRFVVTSQTFSDAPIAMVSRTGCGRRSGHGHWLGSP